MRDYISLVNHSDLSFNSIAKPEMLVDKAIELGYKGLALTESGNISSAIEFLGAAKGKDIKPIIGCKYNISNLSSDLKEPSNRDTAHLTVLAKNLNGWKNMVRANNEAMNSFYWKPRVSLDKFAAYSDDLIAFSGSPWSSLANAIFTDHKAAYRAKNYDEAKGFIDADWYNKIVKLAGEHRDIFADRFFLEIQLIDEENFPATTIIAKALRHLGKKEKIQLIGTGDTHYLNREDARDHWIVVCKGEKASISKIQRGMSTGVINWKILGNDRFFRSMNYHMTTLEKINYTYTEAELDNTIAISDSIESFSLTSKPILPKFECPNGLSSDEYLLELARDGWKRKIQGIIPKNKHKEYAERIKTELNVWKTTDLSTYFLIVHDYVNWALDQGWLVGPGRGSAGGCLTSYLLNITALDPIEEDLMFERFFSVGREATLPDVDSDFEIDKREKVMERLKEKYGENNALQVVTFHRLQGRGCAKEVLRSHDAVSHDEMNAITKFIPDPAAISDELQEMEDEGGDSTTIRWALENNVKELKEWCYLEDGKCHGPLAKYFEQAMRLEGVRVAQGKHASALGLIPDELSDLIPRQYNKNDPGQMLLGFDMYCMESAGILKADLLGTKVLNCLAGVRDFLAGGPDE